MEYAIYEGFYPEVEKKLRRIERKCAAHNCAFHFEVKGEEFRNVGKVDDLGRTIPYSVYVCKFILIEVEGTARVDDWEAIAVMEHTGHGNIVRRINTEIEIPERFYHSDDVCEHCGVRREAQRVFTETGIDIEDWLYEVAENAFDYDCVIDGEVDLDAAEYAIISHASDYIDFWRNNQ